MDFVVVFTLFVFMLALRCFCVAAVFSMIKIYIIGTRVSVRGQGLGLELVFWVMVR